MRIAAIEDLVGGQQTDLLAVEMKVVAAFQGFDALARQFHGPGDLSQREGIGFAGHFHQQSAQHRERERQLQLNAQAAAGLGGDTKVAAHAPDHVLHHVQADAAAGDLGDGFLEREARQEQELQAARTR